MQQNYLTFIDQICKNISNVNKKKAFQDLNKGTNIKEKKQLLNIEKGPIKGKYNPLRKDDKLTSEIEIIKENELFLKEYYKG